MKELELLFVTASAELDVMYVKSMIPLPFDSEVYEGIKEEMMADIISSEITVDSIIEYYEEATYCSMDY